MPGAHRIYLLQDRDRSSILFLWPYKLGQVKKLLFHTLTNDMHWFAWISRPCMQLEDDPLPMVREGIISRKSVEQIE